MLLLFFGCTKFDDVSNFNASIQTRTRIKLLGSNTNRKRRGIKSNMNKRNEKRYN